MNKTKKLSSQQKKERLLIAALSVVAVLMLIFCMNAVKQNDEPSQSPVAGTTVTQQTTVTTTAPTTGTTQAPPDTKAPTQSPTEALTQEPEQTTTAAPVIDETEEILKVVSDSVNLLKSSEADFIGHKVQDINIKLVDSSVPSVNGIINSVISLFAKEETYDYDFTDGVSVDSENGGTVKSYSIFPPGDIDFTLTKEGVAKASKTSDGENTVYTVVIVAETSTLENPRPPHHNAGADTLDLSTVEIPIITLTRVDFDYPGATVSVTLNPDGEVVGYYEHLIISGTGEGYGLGITGYGTIEGYMDEKWDIEWK